MRGAGSGLLCYGMVTRDLGWKNLREITLIQVVVQLLVEVPVEISLKGGES